MFKNTVILAAQRSAVGNFGGALKGKTAVDLGTEVLKGTLDKIGLSPAEVQELVLGCVGQQGLNAFIARMVALNAGCPHSSTAQTVNRLCASGLQAIVTAASLIEHGGLDLTVGGGSESMSNYPYYLKGARWGLRMGLGSGGLEDALTTALAEPFTGPDTHIATTAEKLAEQYRVSRQDQDAYALESQERALAAIGQGYFKEQIIPMEVTEGRTVSTFDTDEYPRSTSLEKLAALRPFAKSDGVVTAGNASGINDGAAMLVLASEEKAKALGLRPLARLVDYAVAGVDPSIMGIGPVPATQKLLEKTGLSINEIDLFEINEAFAAQALACIRELGIPGDKVNVNGSGISLGHPIGATGAIISVKLIHELHRRKQRYGIASLCIGGGQGMSALFEAVV